MKRGKIKLHRVVNFHQMLQVSDLDWQCLPSSYLTPEELQIFLTRDTPSFATLALRGTEPVGTIVCVESATFVEILTLAVAVPHRRTGVGSLLLRQLPDKLISFGVPEDLIENCGFLTRMGFSPAGPVGGQKNSRTHFSFYREAKKLITETVTK